MTVKRLTPEMKTYYEVRWDQLIAELRDIAATLDRPDPVQVVPRAARRQKVNRVVQVDVKHNVG